MSLDSCQPSPKVSWILCANALSNLLDRAIVSCLTQTYPNFELLVITNGESAWKIKQYVADRYSYDTRVRVVASPVHLLNFSLSLGLHLARAPFVARMDADDISKPDRLERQLDYMERNPSVAVLGSSYELINKDGRTQGTVYPPESDSDIRRALYYRNPICHPSVMLRKQIINQIGGYLGGQNAEDYDLWLRIALNPAWKFAGLPTVLLSYNSEPDGAARRSRRAYANVAASRLRNFLLSYDARWLLGSALGIVGCAFRANKP